jgi:hypothetical protein
MQFLQTLPVRRYPHRAFAAERAPPGANAQIALKSLPSGLDTPVLVIHPLAWLASASAEQV